ncbi:hypothetical protein POJ06DRAFT_217226 [Lipomyces tetrasporus]|uniref:Gag protein n=1 Tax=Lipomyces tetrasporus TaxID=54092 RepID=A0AAD7VUY5_9ASCO|nr:uncharacterized protein POJ06DRAFT_217226 [Lipomyces tetrasporus]KAJ8103702.1 hypothetical protein POJ06DRAFT_217226 [Lipomyces tetrasporus]
MSITTNETSTEKIRLTGPNDWEAWNRAFQIRAMASHLWQNIDPDQAKAFLTEPEAPSPSDFRRPHQTRAGSSASTITVGDTSEPQAVDRNGLAFNTAWAVYTHQHKRYKDQESGVEKLRVWVMETVSQHYLESACEPVETITTWYSNLKEQCGQSDQVTKSRAREEYRAAIRPLIKPPKDFEAWVNQWEKAMSHAKKKGVADATDVHVWFEDLSVALKDIPGMDSWVTAYGVSAKVEIREETLSFRTIANDLREEMRRRSKSSKGSNGRIARGAFGPTFSGLSEESLDDRGLGDTSARPDDEPQGRGRLGKVSPGKRKRTAAEGPSRGAKCQACGQPHPLSRCFYVFPEHAQSWWRKNDEIQQKVEQALKTDQDLIKEVAKIKKNESKNKDD